LPPETWIALLGRHDEPVDGVADYCTFLADALMVQGVHLEQHSVDWAGRGWIAALRDLSRKARDWRGRWVLVQYTALGWSRRGFALGALLAVRRLKRRGARVAVMFHEPERQLSGTRFVDRVRGAFQDWIIARLYARAEVAIFADALEAISWLPGDRSKAVFIPIGANVPAPATRARTVQVSADSNPGASSAATAAGERKQRLAVAIYCLSTLPNRERELRDVGRAIESAAAQGAALRVVFLGRGTEDSEAEIRAAIPPGTAEIEILGLQDLAAVSRVLASSDIMLSVRGPLFPRRGSVIAGIACGLPIVAYGNSKNAFPLSEAGIELVPWHEPEAFATAFARIARDATLRQSLRARSHEANEKYFSWESIAGRYAMALSGSAFPRAVASAPTATKALTATRSSDS
jgi:glycosyltransferase involved in cell wall biosynthesis